MIRSASGPRRLLRDRSAASALVLLLAVSSTLAACSGSTRSYGPIGSDGGSTVAGGSIASATSGAPTRPASGVSTVAGASTASAPSSAPTTRASVESTEPTAAARRATVPPGAALPSEAECAASVVPSPEIRPGNKVFNERRGRQKNLAGPYYSKVTGDFVGTTDEILQWVACKWGIDVDIVRAQAAKESYWTMDHPGDFTDQPSSCAPGHELGKDGEDGKCPESIGMFQVRWNYTGAPAGLDTWPDLVESTAYHADFTYAYWRSCYEGTLDWLNTTDRVGTYAAGDEWGCVGNWYAGRWRTPPAEEYIAAVQKYVKDRIWETGSFIRYRG